MEAAAITSMLAGDSRNHEAKPAIFLRNIAPATLTANKSEGGEAAGDSLLEAMTAAYEKRCNESWKPCGLDGMSAFTIERIDYIGGGTDGGYTLLELHGINDSGQDCKITIEASGGGFNVNGSIDTQEGGNR